MTLLPTSGDFLPAKLRVRALFPRYLFIHINTGMDDWRPVRLTAGVTRIIESGGRVAPPVPAKSIEPND